MISARRRAARWGVAVLVLLCAGAGIAPALVELDRQGAAQWFSTAPFREHRD